MSESDYATDLGHWIAENHKNESFTFFSGNLRQDDLPEILANACVDLNEIQVYQTLLTPQKISAALDGILFFSPSAVESFLKENQLESQFCCCIGQTTAKALQGHTKNIAIANQPSVENVIVQCINHYSQNKA